MRVLRQSNPHAFAEGAARAHADAAGEDRLEYSILVPHSDYGDPECCGIIAGIRWPVKYVYFRFSRALYLIRASRFRIM